MSPTARSLKWLRDQGWIAGVVEQTIHMPGRPWGNKRDLWGFADVVAVHPTGRLMFVQITSSGNLAARVTKAKAVAEVALSALGKMVDVRVEFHGWAKRGPRGKVKRWALRRLDHNGMEVQ